MTDRSIALAAAPFGYGPRVACERLLSELGLQHTLWKPTIAPVEAETLLNFGVVTRSCVHRRSRRKVWIDCLTWLRTELPETVLLHDICLAEAFFPTSSSLESGIEFFEVRPLIGIHAVSAPPRTPRDLLVSFGGVQTLYGTHIHHETWPSQLIRALNGALDSEASLLVHGPRDVIPAWRRQVSSSRVVFDSPTREVHEERASGAGHVILQPGLYGAFEAFATKRRVSFMPAFSYTQAGQALLLAKHQALDIDPWTENLLASFGKLTFSFGQEQADFYQHIEKYFLASLSSGQITEQLRTWATTTLAIVDAKHTAARERICQRALAHPRASDVLSVLLAEAA